jgi:anti-sigma B factor antagonist
MVPERPNSHDVYMTATCQATLLHPEPDLAVIELVGDVDSGAEEALRNAYAAAAALGPSRVLLDFERVGYINSTGIALIVGILALARREQRQLIARGLSERYRQLFDITRLSDFIQVLAPEASV